MTETIFLDSHEELFLVNILASLEYGYVVVVDGKETKKEEKEKIIEDDDDDIEIIGLDQAFSSVVYLDLSSPIIERMLTYAFSRNIVVKIKEEKLHERFEKLSL